MSDRLQDHLRQVERAAEDVLADKREIVDLDKRRQAAREASSALEKEKGRHWKGDGRGVWLAMGGANCFLKVSAEQATKRLKNGEKKKGVMTAAGEIFLFREGEMAINHSLVTGWGGVGVELHLRRPDP